MERTWKTISFVLASAMFGGLLTAAIMSTPGGLQSAFAQRAMPQNLQAANDLSSAFRQVADTMRPSVVSISTLQKQRVIRRGGRGNSRGGLPEGFLDGLPPGLRDQLFGDDFEIIPQQESETGSGSGVIIRADGYILTNNHVVEGADALKVELFDGRRLDAEIVGRDPQTDLAVIKINDPNITPAVLGDSESTQVGDWVLAFGSPFGLDQTVTAGIISAKNRVQGIVGDGSGFEDFLQTDAAINPGNSGGPLVNLRGEVIGINTAIASRSGGYNGIGFTIPTSLARPVVDSLIKTGAVQRGFLGARLDEITPERAKELGLSSPEGAYIDVVLDGQPAANGGLRSGDVVTSVNGRAIRDLVQLRNMVATTPPNTTLDMNIIRGGRQLNVKVVLGERTARAMARFNVGGELWGAKMEPLTEETAQQFGVDPRAGGLLVENVTDGSKADKSGLDAGDVILRVAGQPIDSFEQLSQLNQLAEQTGRALPIVIQRGNQRGVVTIK